MRNRIVDLDFDVLVFEAGAAIQGLGHAVVLERSYIINLHFDFLVIVSINDLYLFLLLLVNLNRVGHNILCGGRVVHRSSIVVVA